MTTETPIHPPKEEKKKEKKERNEVALSEPCSPRGPPLTRLCAPPAAPLPLHRPLFCAPSTAGIQTPFPAAFTIKMDGIAEFLTTPPGVYVAGAVSQILNPKTPGGPVVVPV